jgi:hypothetical protein
LQCRIDDAKIWIPGGEVARFFYHRKNKLLKRLKKEFPEQLGELKADSADVQN